MGSVACSSYYDEAAIPPDIALVKKFAVALMEHDSLAYELAVEGTHEHIDEWVHSTKKLHDVQTT
ncbi:MAG: hypothetical protein LRY67_02140 [Gammaproteobacteria bacterium]|nr:hypothetical protein [Gammaproteobacteria bacterium]